MKLKNTPLSGTLLIIMKEKILNVADELFIKYGVKSVTMDDIARELSISKKTIYQFFKDKNEIVKEFTLSQCNCRRDDFEEIPQKSRNSVEALIMVTKCIRQNVLTLNPLLLMEVKRYYNDAWNIFLEFKEHTFYKSLEKTIIRGINEGYFREEINPEIIAIMRMEQVQSCFDPKVYPTDRFDFKEVQMQLLDHFIYGLLTPKGQKLFNNYLNNSKNG